MSELKKQAIAAIKWSSITIILGKISGIGFSIIKYRFLVPEDFGIMAIVIAIISIMRMIQTLGYNAVLVQRGTINEVLINSVFWVITSVSIFIAVCLILLSGWISNFYNVEILVFLLPIAAVQFVFNSYIIVQNSLLARYLNFKIIGLIQLVSDIAGSLIVIGFALCNYGVWSLIFGSIGSSIITFSLYLKYIRWVPSFVFNWEVIKSSTSFGLSITLRKILGQITITAPPLIIGKFFGTDILGIYSFANSIIQMIIGQVDAMISQVLLPLFSRLQNDKARLINGYLKVNHYTFLLVMPMLAGYMFVAKDLIGIVYGQKWLPAVLISQIILIAIVIGSVYAKASSLITGIGRPQLLLRLELYLFVPVFSALLITAKFGIIYLVTAMAIGKIVTFIMLQFILKHCIGLKFIEFVKCLKEPLLATMAMVLILFLIKLYLLVGVDPKVSLVVMIIAGALCYSLAVFYLDRRELIPSWKLLHNSVLQAKR